MKELIRFILIVGMTIFIVIIPYCYGRYYDTDTRPIFQVLFIGITMEVYRLVDKYVDDGGNNE